MTTKGHLVCYRSTLVTVKAVMYLMQYNTIFSTWQGLVRSGGGSWIRQAIICGSHISWLTYIRTNIRLCVMDHDTTIHATCHGILYTSMSSFLGPLARSGLKLHCFRSPLKMPTQYLNKVAVSLYGVTKNIWTDWLSLLIGQSSQLVLQS